MRFLLDTNVCVDYLTGRYAGVALRIRRASPSDICSSSVVVAELRFGADHSTSPRANHARLDILVTELACLDFDLAAAAAYGKLRARLELSGTPIGPNDMLIAAQALSRGMVLVTDNEREFRRVKGLKVENWRH